MPYNPITAAYKMPFTERNAHQWEVIRRYNAHDELRQTLYRLYFESMHYRNTGGGVQFLNKALIHAGHMLDFHDDCTHARKD